MKRWSVTIRREQARSHYAFWREGKQGKEAYSGCLSACGMCAYHHTWQKGRTKGKRPV
ncbi:MAG: hypothetical protein KBT34_08560 [Prevotella sp.]|nr:hypothetical protein [Candidatus Prevotella equi]